MLRRAATRNERAFTRTVAPVSVARARLGCPVSERQEPQCRAGPAYGRAQDIATGFQFRGRPVDHRVFKAQLLGQQGGIDAFIPAGCPVFTRGQEHDHGGRLELRARRLQRGQGLLQTLGVIVFYQAAGTAPASSRIAIDLDAGVWLKSPWWLSGISGLVSG